MLMSTDPPTGLNVGGTAVLMVYAALAMVLAPPVLHPIAFKVSAELNGPTVTEAPFWQFEDWVQLGLVPSTV